MKIKFLPVGTKGFQATKIEGVGSEIVKKTFSEVVVKSTRTVFFKNGKINILITTDKGMFCELYKTEEDAQNETNPIEFQEIEIDAKDIDDVVFLKEKGLTTIDRVFIDFDTEMQKVHYCGYNSIEGFYFSEEEIVERQNVLIKEGRKLAGQYIEDHVNIKSEHQISKFLDAIDVPANIEMAKIVLEKGMSAKNYAEESLKKINYISSLKKEKDKLVATIDSETEKIMFFQKMITELENLNQKDTFIKKLKVLADLKMVRVY